ncbi:MAG: 50S ribosomal protein L4 [Nanoarchaeota archaeon]|nr:50S ribosomal protein L4 [Nanoarchaeota archaeon]MBU2458848.1 50S ribosomal protein L4 [Nanoarchaeota archaeon]
MAEKIQVFDIEGKKAREIEMPEFFSAKIREDIVAKTLEAKKSMQPYSPSPVAGKQHSASGKLVRRRHVWKSGYGKGMSRVPRKAHSRKGSQFNWTAAEVSSVRGGRRAHPPKVISMINVKRINKKELKIAMISALSATANKKEIMGRYESITDKDITRVPFIVESKLVSLKTKDLISSLKKILGEGLFEKIEKKRSVRAGKGKMRGRKYKTNAGLLLVTGEKEEVKTSLVESKKAKNLGVVDLARGGLGRVTVYTENAVKELQKNLGGKND